ncbi:MAG: TlyA family RNA methyltransferase [Clostridia bacterium]|nr:TlyA family RNA methyltransferase [Clostridia bacterium]
MAKIRLDALLVNSGLVQSRERAKALIMAGQIYIENQKCDKAGLMVDEDNTKVEIRGEQLKYVSRGGLKLEKALNEFPISLEGKTTMDIGASTGGFTDCMLQNGAKKVFAVDVGYGQFAWKLRQDERVVNMERTNIRYVTPEQIGEEINFASIDVSFISLKLVLPVAYNLLSNDGELVALIKPQFEAGRAQVGKKGVVRDINVHYEVIKTVLDFARSINFYVAGLSFSPIKGPEGNIEYLAYFKKSHCDDNITDEIIHQIVDMSHSNLQGGGDTINA